MKIISLFGILAVQLLSTSSGLAGAGQFPTLTKAEANQVRNRLVEYEHGKLTLEQVTETGGKETALKIISYYLSDTNGVSTKMKLPIGRCYAFFGLFPEASQLANSYVYTYSNDWRGWDLLGGTKMLLELHDESLAAITNAIRLGSDRNIAAAGVAALKVERMDVFESLLLKRLLSLKNSITNSVGDELTEKDKLQMTSLLVAYSLKAKKEEVFVAALKDVSVTQVKSHKTLQAYVEAGCELFKVRDTAKLCEQLITGENEPRGNHK